jgi:hypothetical protein
MIRRIYIKGRFKGYFSGDSSGNSGEHLSISHDLIFNEKWITDAEETEAYNEKLLTYEPYLLIASLKDLYISWKNEEPDVFFHEDLEEVVINNLEVSRQPIGKQAGIMEGDFYGVLKLQIPEVPVTEIHSTKGKQVISTRNVVIDKSGNHTGNIRTDETGVFSNPWQPDELLNNFGITRASWENWKTRWADENKGLIIKLLAILFLIASGMLSYPIFWLLLMILLIKCSDSFIRVISPLAANDYNVYQNSNVGSGKVILRIFYVILLLGACFLFLNQKLNLFAAIAAILLLLHFLSRSSIFLFVFRRIFQGIALLLFLFAFLRFNGSDSSDNRPLPVQPTDNDDQLIPDKQDSTKNGNQYSINWQDYRSRKYKGAYSISANIFSQSMSHRNALTVTSKIEEAYPPIYRFDKKLLDGIIPMFEKIHEEKKLNPVEFAEMAGCFVQRIPYVLVHEYSCRELLSMAGNNEFIRQYHREGKQCLQNCKFGIQAPAEFTYNLKGDCDTRVLFLYTLLDHFGYDVAILTSDIYSHAILGIGLPYSGLYKSYSGIRYYAWELTSPGWQPGLLAPQISNMNNWKISMINR